MRSAALPVRTGARAGSRLPSLARTDGDVAATELVVLSLLGAAAGCLAALVKLHLRVPGHQIIFSVFPMALGVALVPRRAAGTIMGASALVAALALRGAGLGEMGGGAWASLLAAGPLLDLALAGARGGLRLYAAFILAGLGANLLALAVRAALKLSAGAAGPEWARWWPRAGATYLVSGLLAGLLSAAAWFHFRDRPGAPGVAP